MFCCQERRPNYNLRNEIQELIIWRINEAKLKPINCSLEIDLQGRKLTKNPSDIKFLQQQLKQMSKLYQLKKLTLNFQGNQLGNSEKCIQYLCDLIKNLPKSLEYLDLQLDNNRLGNANNAFQLKQIFQNFKYLPQMLETFYLSLQNSNIMDFSIKFLSEDLNQIPQSVKNFRLDLSLNNLITFNIFKLLPETLTNIEIVMKECNLGLKELDKDFFFGLPQGLQSLCLDLEDNYFGSYSPALQKLAQCMKKIPQNLEKFTLNLNNNRLGKFNEDFKNLAEGLQQLPKQINELEFNLAQNQLGNSKQNVEVLFKIFRSIISQKQKSFSLNLASNNLGKYQEFRKNLAEIIGILPNSTQTLCLDLQDNDLGDNIENMKFLANLFKNMDQNITCLKVNLSKNNLGNNEENFKYLEEALKGMMKSNKLSTFEIDLRECKLEQSTNCLSKIYNSLKEVPKTLKNIDLQLNYDEINENDALKMYSLLHPSNIFYKLRYQLQEYLPQVQNEMLS